MIVLFSHMQNNLIPLFKDSKSVVEIFERLEYKYSRKSSTYIQLLLEWFNALTMFEDSSMMGHVNHMAFIVKVLVTSGNPIIDKMQVSTILNSLLPSRDLVVISLNCGNELSLDSLPSTLSLEEKEKSVESALTL